MALFDKLGDMLEKTDLDDKLIDGILDKTDIDDKLLKKIGLDGLDKDVVKKVKTLIDKVDLDKIDIKSIAKKVDIDEDMVKKIISALKKSLMMTASLSFSLLPRMRMAKST